jgi:hypothetical protein
VRRSSGFAEPRQHHLRSNIVKSSHVELYDDVFDGDSVNNGDPDLAPYHELMTAERPALITTTSGSRGRTVQ